jgi:hypothetical protein
MRKIKHIASGGIFTVEKKPEWRGGVWECGDQRFIDATGTEYVVDGWGDPVELAAIKTAFIKQVDQDADAIINAVVGSRLSQYQSAESQALAYAAAGYSGVVPPKVQAWATAKNQTATWAADDQIAKATALHDAEDELYANRLLRKEQARNSADVAALDVVKSQWVAFTAALRLQLGL